MSCVLTGDLAFVDVEEALSFGFSLVDFVSSLSGDQD